jgi:hypothetical protein
MRINRHKLLMLRSASLRQEPPSRLPSRHPCRVAHQLRHPPLPLHRPQPLLRRHDLLQRRGPAQYPGLVPRRHRVRRLRIRKGVVAREEPARRGERRRAGRTFASRRKRLDTPRRLQRDAAICDKDVYRMPVSHCHWTFVIFPATTSTSKGPNFPIPPFLPLREML